MKQQIIVIHGADTFTTYEDYIRSLENRTMELESINKKSWKSRLGSDLGSEYEVYLPQMPNKDNAKYKEWKIIFDKILPLLDKDAIFIGHSMGAIFLAKYFSESDTGEVKALFLVAPPYEDSAEESLDDFNFTADLSLLSKQVKNIFIYHSKDDYVVPFAHGEEYAKRLPGSRFKVFEDRGHFNQETFPEILEDIQSIH